MTPAEEAEIVRTHKPFVFKHALKASKTSGRDLDDCVQDAYVALVLACRSWRPDGGANIRTYATTALKRDAMHAWQARNREKRQRVDVSFDAERNNDEGGDEYTLHDVLGLPATQEEDVDAARIAVVLRKAMMCLTRQERDVIERRFFEDETLEEVGAEQGLTRERIRQIEDRALDKLCLALVRRGVSR